MEKIKTPAFLPRGNFQRKRNTIIKLLKWNCKICSAGGAERPRDRKALLKLEQWLKEKRRSPAWMEASAPHHCILRVVFDGNNEMIGRRKQNDKWVL